MKILIVDTYYPQFLKEFVGSHPELTQASYEDRRGALMAAHFAEADSYSFYLSQLGHNAVEIIANADFLQHRWAREHDLRTRSTRGILLEQVKHEQPDVLYVQNMGWVDSAQLKALREHVRLIVGQIASPLPPNCDLSNFDLILSSFPHFVRFFRNIGVSSEYFRLGFDPRVLAALDPPHVVAPKTNVPIAFVGGLSNAHHKGTLLLEAVARELPLSVWGYGAESLPIKSPLRRIHKGQAWALDMYRALANSQIALNRHIDVAGRFANNLRLYEATGVGTCLVTDAHNNLAQLFEPDREVVSYTNHEDCVEKCRYLLDHDAERAAIARAGQKRTLSAHTWEHRMGELDEILNRHLRYPTSASRKAFAAPPPIEAADQFSPRLRDLARQLPGQRLLRTIYRRLPKRIVSDQQISCGHRIIDASDVTPTLLHGWQSPNIAPRQRQLVDSQLAQMYQGNVAPVFRVAAEAIRATGMENGLLVEIGCASGYYSEVIQHLLRQEINYFGIDYSLPLIQSARHHYPESPFLVGDATALPLAAGTCDILFSGTVLLHVPDYVAVIRESARVTRHWCVFHRTPVVQSQETACMSKLAYGTEVVELVFSEEELHQLFERFGLKVERAITIDAYPMRGVAGTVAMTTYVCRKQL